MARRIFIGDVQGCMAQLGALLDRLALRADDRLWCVGDLVNRGPDSLGVLRCLRHLEVRSVLGNHDLHLLRLAAAGRVDQASPSLTEVLRAPDRDALLGWLGHRPVIQSEADVVVVHGGLHPAWTDIAATAEDLNHAVPAHLAGHSDARIAFATEVRYCTAEGRRPPLDDPPPGAPYAPWDHWYRGDRIVVFGHWARRGLVRQGRARGLDTGCVYGGKLTAWIAEEDDFVQVAGWHGY
jgi:bis(5'-nucleosyl)-tetraphosphatase (symmetrical)